MDGISKSGDGILYVPAGEDQFGEHRGLGINTIDFKMTPSDSSGVFILEITNHAKGGPARHFHYDQDEWFYILEGEFALEIGDEKFRLKPGDSMLVPRKVPHVWAYVGDGGRGRMLVTFLPAGKMEGFFRETSKANAMPGQIPELWRTYGMEVVGPPLSIE